MEEIKWIDVKKEVPPQREEVLIATKAYTTTAMRNNETWIDFWNELQSFDANEVTHWAYLPEPPK